MLTLSEIIIYPVKSLGGIPVSSAMITSRGLQHDRRWVLCDENNVFITQRNFNKMTLLKTCLVDDGFEISHSKNNSVLKIPFEINEGRLEKVKIWSDDCEAYAASSEINKWFSDALETTCKLFYMPDLSSRMTKKKSSQKVSPVSFADGYPYLIIGQSSLDDLNKRLQHPVPMNRFRPNFVFTGGQPYEEDLFDALKIGEVIFRGVKPCERCVIPTIDQATAKTGKEPSATLSTYRSVNNAIHFGMNLIGEPSSGIIKNGDAISVISRKDSLF